MPESTEERDPAMDREGSNLLRTQENEEASPLDQDPSAVADRIRQIAASLDVDALDEEELGALSDAALRLASVAKAQGMRKRDIASRMAQVEDWETDHADAIAGADTVTDALAALRTRIAKNEVDGGTVTTALDLLEQWLSVDARYQTAHKKLKQAVGDTDFASVRSLADTLESLMTERSEAAVALEGVSFEPSPGDPTPDKPVPERTEPSEPEKAERADVPDEPDRATDQTEPEPTTTVDPSEDAPETTSEADHTPRDQDEQGRTAPDDTDPTLPEDDQPNVEPVEDPTELDDVAEGSVQRTEEAIAASIDRGRLGLAYHLALALPDALPTADAIKLAAYSYVTDERAPIAAELTELAAALLHEAEELEHTGPGWRGHVLFTTCAALAPALAAPGGPVSQLLAFFDRWLDDTPSLRALVKTAADVSMKGVHLPIDLLREQDPPAKWRERELALRNETESWIKTERQSTIRFQAATKVWRRMLEDWKRRNGQPSLGRLFSFLNEPIDSVDAESLTEMSEYWRAQGDREIDRIDREIRSWKPTNRIEGSARLSLRNKVNRAVSLADRWIRLIGERPDKVLPFHAAQAKVLRTSVNNNVDLALTEMDAVSIHMVQGARQLLRRYAGLFHLADVSIDRVPIGVTDLLNGDLLVHPDIVFDDTGQLAHTPIDSAILRDLVNREKPDFGEAGVERAKRGDFLGAEAAVDFGERSRRIDDASAELARNAIDDQREEIQSRLTEKINETSNRLDVAYAAGALTLGTYDHQRDRIPQVDLSETDTFAPLFAKLEEIDNEIANAQAGRRNAIRGSLVRLRGLSREDRGRIESAVASGRFQVAEDFIERIERGEELPALQTTDDRPFDRFFPHFVDRYVALCDQEGDGVVHARSLIASRDSDEFIDASLLSEDGSRDGIDLLEAWERLRDGGTSSSRLNALMNALGFTSGTVQRTNEETLGGEEVFALYAAPVADRSIVQLPDFGSRANGRYRLFAVRRRKTEEAIIREVGRQNGPGRPPNIALFFGILDADARRSLAREFRSEEYHPTIVLDESLVVFLAAWRGNRLGAFFDCVSAFTFSQPFEPDAAELPPEMFFGRASARRAILAMSHDMSHLVYGGRRLGKTTLLADIARDYRKRAREAPEELVLLINLKGSGIGEDRPTEDLWPLFAETLAEYGVVSSRTRVAKSVGKSVKRWLEEIQGRRILLLVDEADAFLGAECKPKQGYRVLEQVKRLMEETGRRFKVVFAGLHNVQRTARDPNTPFAHLGEAIRIGPMLPENDGDAIQNLIRGPLEALGYRFVSDDSVIRIAAETNYYPALAQQFCKELLKTLRDESYTLSQTGPPYRIRRELVDRVFSARETRDRIRNLFSWTIELDPRFEFLTYLIAQRSFDNEDGRPQAMPIEAIRDEALSEWPKGFSADSSFWTFEVILEEMIGLGILREAGNKEYAIRTRNLRSLLGSDDEIERRFKDAKNRIAPPVFDRAQFRSTLKGDTVSSLTAHQESRLMSGRYAVALIFGTHLAGLQRVADSLRGAADKRDEWLFREAVAPGASPRSSLRRALRSRKPGIHVVLIDMRDAWDSEMLGRVLAFVGKHEWQDRIIRPVFLCDPQGAWTWLSESVPSEEGVELQDFWLAPCGRDFTHTWLKNRESRAYDDLDKPDQDVDLPWPLVVEAAAGNKQLKFLDEAIRIALDGDQAEGHVADIVDISKSTDTALRLLSTFPDEPITPDFLSELSEDGETSLSPEEVIDFFNWASRLGIVCRDEKGHRLDSTYAEGLRRVFAR